jgi:hypothetical protein
MRPDYIFGLGREGIDMTVLTRNGGDGMTMDPQLMEAVTADLEATCPEQYRTIWDLYQAKLRPGQRLSDRHDLVLRMVRDIQLQKRTEQQPLPPLIDCQWQPPPRNRLLYPAGRRREKETN